MVVQIRSFSVSKQGKVTVISMPAEGMEKKKKGPNKIRRT